MASSETSVVRMSMTWSNENPKSCSTKMPTKKNVCKISEKGDPRYWGAAKANASTREAFGSEEGDSFMLFSVLIFLAYVEQKVKSPQCRGVTGSRKNE